jgi:hypothetical protein
VPRKKRRQSSAPVPALPINSLPSASTDTSEWPNQPNIIERIKRELQDTQPGLGIEEIRRRLAKIRGSVAAEIIAERGER